MNSKVHRFSHAAHEPELTTCNEEEFCRYFRDSEAAYELLPEVHEHIHFSCLNFNEDVFSSLLNETVAMDLILCRNVFICLDRNTSRSIMTKFPECLVNSDFRLSEE